MVVKCEGNVDNSERGYYENAEINKDLSQGLNTMTSVSLLVLGVILNQQMIICGLYTSFCCLSTSYISYCSSLNGSLTQMQLQLATLVGK